MNSKNKTYSKYMELPKKTILGVGVTDASINSILEYIFNSFKKSTKPYYIVTPNPEIIVLANKNNDFKNVLNNAKLALHDGVGVGIAAHFVGKSLQERFNGVELVEKVCEKSNDWPITVGFLGAGPKVAERAVECLKGLYPNLRVVFVAQEWRKEGFDLARKYQAVGNMYYAEKPRIHNTKYVQHNTDVDKIDILFVAFGAPKQEMWMAEHIGKIPVTVMAGVGGAFDQLVNPSLRPPRLVQKIGLGWLYRLVRQPWRIKRQLSLVEFVWLVTKERFNKKTSS